MSLGRTREVTKVLIVDPHEEIRTILTDLFKKRGYWIQAVGTAQEALTEVKKNPYHLAIIDIHLPDQSGAELVAEIRQINFNINCILTTGYSKAPPEESFNKGPKAHFGKPLAIEELVKIFQERLNE